MSHPIACQDALQRLWGYLDDELDGGDRHALERHLAWCVTCCGELEFARELRGFLADRGKPPVPDAALSRLERFVENLDDPGHDTDDHGRQPWVGT